MKDQLNEIKKVWDEVMEDEEENEKEQEQEPSPDAEDEKEHEQEPSPDAEDEKEQEQEEEHSLYSFVAEDEKVISQVHVEECGKM